MNESALSTGCVPRGPSVVLGASCSSACECLVHVLPSQPSHENCTHTHTQVPPNMGEQVPSDERMMYGASVYVGGKTYGLGSIQDGAVASAAAQVACPSQADTHISMSQCTNSNNNNNKNDDRSSSSSSMQGVPLKHSSISLAEGLGLLRSSVYSDITIPGVQNPHCEPCACAMRSYTHAHTLSSMSDRVRRPSTIHLSPRQQNPHKAQSLGTCTGCSVVLVLPMPSTVVMAQPSME